MEGAFYEGIMGLGKESLVQWPVSFFLSKEEDKSFITFGGYNKEFLKDKQINYFGIEDQWKINIDKLEYKWDGNDNRYKEL